MHTAIRELPSAPAPPCRPVAEPVTVVIAAGGTGGHIYPGLAVAASIRARQPDARILFVGTPFGMESELIPAAGYPLFLVDMAPFSRRAGWRRYVAPAVAARAAWQSRGLLRREGASVVVGMGGYPSLPVIAGARLAGISAVIHESNAVPGRANRLCAQMTSNVALALETAGSWPQRGDARLIGMPISGELRSFDRERLRVPARARLGIKEGTTLVVVCGGSQGSARLDAASIELACAWRERHDVRLLVKTSRGNSEAVHRRIAEAGGERVASAVAYFDRMDDVYAAADLMICRAGAATVAELSIVGVPAILVPYPHAPGDHQTHNARALATRGSAVVVPDAQAGGPAWLTLVDSLIGNPDRLRSMATAATGMAQAEGADRLAAWALELAKESAR